MSPRESLAAGTLVAGRYELAERLGDGTFGDVWKAFDVNVRRRPVAVKFLKTEFLDNTEVVARFESEIAALVAIHHPNVVTVIDEGKWPGERFLVIEYVEGMSLAHWVAARRGEGRQPDLETVRAIFDQVCTGVAAAHAVRVPGEIVHRDPKPANVMLSPQSTGEVIAKVLDFGIAQLGSRLHTQSGFQMGTLPYMAPEQGLGRMRDVGPPTDVFALGVILVEMLTLRMHPGENDDGDERWWGWVMQRSPELRGVLGSLRPDVPGAVWDVVVRAMQVDVRQRYPNAGAFRDALRDAWQEARAGAMAPTAIGQPPVRAAPAEPMAKPPPGALLPRPEPSSARRVLLPVVGVTAAMVVVLGVGTWASRGARGGNDARDGGTTVVNVQATAAPVPSPCPDGMVPIPAGTFMMGSPDGVGDPDEHPQHRVTLSAYCMDRTEVTVGQYRACTAAAGCQPVPTTVNWPGISESDRTPYSQWCNGDRENRINHPINCVDWNQADAYCRWAGKQLPTEAQWEYAARGSDGRSYPWGDANPSDQLCWGLEHGTCSVGSHPGGASPFGLMDMAGNVWEWTADWYGSYGAFPQENPTGPVTGSSRVDRGGGWGDSTAFWVRAAVRHGSDVADRVHAMGFRCARGARR